MGDTSCPTLTARVKTLILWGLPRFAYGTREAKHLRPTSRLLTIPTGLPYTEMRMVSGATPGRSQGSNQFLWEIALPALS